MSFCSRRQRGDVTKPPRIKTQRAAIKQLRRLFTITVRPSLICDSSQNTRITSSGTTRQMKLCLSSGSKYSSAGSMKRRIIQSWVGDEEAAHLGSQTERQRRILIKSNRTTITARFVCVNLYICLSPLSTPRKRYRRLPPQDQTET